MHKIDRIKGIIRPLTEQDILLLKPLLQEAIEYSVREGFDDALYLDWLESGQALVEIRALLQSDNGFFVVFDVGGDYVGYLVGSADLPGSTTAQLKGVYVRPEFRKMGIGRELCEAFFRWCQDQGCRKVTVAAAATNAVALRWYRESGFSECTIILERACEVK